MDEWRRLWVRGLITPLLAVRQVLLRVKQPVEEIEEVDGDPWKVHLVSLTFPPQVVLAAQVLAQVQLRDRAMFGPFSISRSESMFGV